MKWKRKGTETVFVAVCAVVLIASYGIGLCIREIRFRRAAVATVTNEVQKTSLTDKEITKTPEPERESTTEGRAPVNDRGFAGEEGPEFGGERPGMMRRFDNMSEEDRSQMRERFGGGRRGGRRFENLSEEERAEMEERRRQMRERMENMSEEEREEFRAQMRGRFGGRRRGAGDPNSERQEND